MVATYIYVSDKDLATENVNVSFGTFWLQIFDKTGTFKFQFGVPGKEEGQLWYPRKVAVMRNNGKFVVCDRGNERSRMQIFTKNGHFIKKIAIRYIDIVAGLAVTSQGHIVAVDSVSPTVFVISDTGELLRWFDCSDYMREPSDIAISGRHCFLFPYEFVGRNRVTTGNNVVTWRKHRTSTCKRHSTLVRNAVSEFTIYFLFSRASYTNFQARNISFATSKDIALWCLTKTVNSCVALAVRI